MIRRILIVGGANGIGLSIAKELCKSQDCEKIYILDKSPLAIEFQEPKIESDVFDLYSSDYSILEKYSDINALMITAGFGHLELFKDVSEEYIVSSFNVNAIAPIRIIRKFMDKLCGQDDFYCGIMVSIAGFMSSPFFAVYGATKAALKIFVESVNVELVKAGTSNRILNVSPGSIKGTSFNNGSTDLSQTSQLANEIIENLVKKNDLFIPQYEEIYRKVLNRYADDFRAEGLHSYEYKEQSGRIN